MKDLYKVSSTQIFDVCKNVVMGLLAVIGVMVGSKLLPFYFAPIVGLVGAAFLFSILYNNKLRGGSSCMIVPYALFFCLVSYSFISILVNVLYIWGWMNLPDEFIFFNDPYFPTLWMNPIAFVSLLIVYLRRKHLQVCIDCRLKNGTHSDRGVFGSIMNTESKFQLKQLMILAGVLTVIVWAYYIIEYKEITTNAKDRYIFFWISVIGLVLDIFYYLYRYYNLYLDLKENNELISPEELQGISAKTYLRYYVICGNKVYLNPDTEDATNPEHRGIDTPFFAVRNSANLTAPEVKTIVRDMAEGLDGELRFFFGRKTPDLDKHVILRYFYFLDGNPEDYPEMNVPGMWLDFEEVKMVYNQHPDLIATLAINDLTRLATIVTTEKLYKENGERRFKIKSYKPSFDLIDVRDSNLEFQDDKWLRIANFNADSPFFKLRKRWRKFLNSIYAPKKATR